MTFEDIVSSSIVIVLSFKCQTSADSFNIIFPPSLLTKAWMEKELSLPSKLVNKRTLFPTSLFPSTKEA